MHIVAIGRLATSLEEEAAALAADLGTLAYDERLKLGALPSVVLITPDAARADSLLERLRARGHQALACRASDVVPSSELIALERFRLDDDGLVAGDGSDARLPWSDLAALLRAVERRRVESTDTVKEKKFNLTRAIATGGLIRSKTTSQQVTTHTDENEQVLYLFRRSGAAPWILREQQARYAALGAQMAPTALPNFLRTVELLRARAPQAVFDERLVGRRRPHAPAAQHAPSPHNLDLLAHLLAASLTR